MQELRVDKQVLLALLRKDLVQWNYVEDEYVYKPASFEPSVEQNTAIRSITQQLSSFGVHVLDGVTGSGKTEVYIQVIKQVLEAGKQVLVSSPKSP